MPASQRRRSIVMDASGTGTMADRLVTGIDLWAVCRLADRAHQDGIITRLIITRRGVPYVVLPAWYLSHLSQSEADRWGFVSASFAYLLRVIVPGHWRTTMMNASIAGTEPEKSPVVNPSLAPPELGADFQRHQW